MQKIEVTKERFKDFWKTRDKTIRRDIEEDELIKITYEDQWLLCRVKEGEENKKIRILLAKYLPY